MEQSDLLQASQASVSQDVADRLPKQVALPLFEAALARLGLAGTNGEVTALFDGRATWNQVRDWRRGRNRVPKWAWDYLGVLLDQHIVNTARIRASVRNPPDIAPGRGAGREIAAWNARRAALKK
jgi:hypothetical protein